MTRSKNKLKLQQRINDYILSTYGEHIPGKPGLVLTESGNEFDLYGEIIRIFYQAENTRGKRKGNRESFAKKNMQYFPRDFQHAEDKFKSLQDNLDITVSEIEALKSKNLYWMTYVLHRHSHSIASKKATAKGNVEKAPSGNGRQTTGLMAALFALSDLSGNPDQAEKIKKMFCERYVDRGCLSLGRSPFNKNGKPHKRSVSWQHLAEIGKDETGTKRSGPRKTSHKTTKVLDVDKQPTLSREIEVVYDKVAIDEPLR
tara:strand:+ start:64 stop:837 length:774 start_codon:yes stop_codon:yes gene_type:complete